MQNIDLNEIIELEKDLKQISDSVLSQNLTQAAFIAGSRIQSDARATVAVDTGALKISIENSVSQGSTDITASVGPTQPYGKDIEFGRPPGTHVSPAALMGWAKRKGLNPYAVAKSIERKGSPAQPFLFPAFEKNERGITQIIAQGVVNAFKQVFNLK